MQHALLGLAGGRLVKWGQALLGGGFAVCLAGACVARGVGARVTVSAGRRTQIRERTGGGSFLSSNDPRLHFGLGDAPVAERGEVRCPSGTRDALAEGPPDRLITVV